MGCDAEWSDLICFLCENVKIGLNLYVLGGKNWSSFKQWMKCRIVKFDVFSMRTVG